MKITVRQLKTLIREAAAEAMEEMNEVEEKEEPVAEAELQEAVAAAFRAGYRRGRTAPATRTSKR